MPSGADAESLPASLGRYEVLGAIASGGMATVYLARVTGLAGFEREVALKLTHAHLRDEPDFVTSLMDEARLAGRIRHQNVVSVLDVGVDPAGVRFVKADTQGTELFVLEGAQRVLAQPAAAWMLEISPALIEKAGADMRQLIAVMQRHFAHFIDLEATAPRARIRETTELAEGLAYLDERRMNTNIVAWHGSV